MGKSTPGPVRAHKWIVPGIEERHVYIKPESILLFSSVQGGSGSGFLLDFFSQHSL